MASLQAEKERLTNSIYYSLSFVVLIWAIHIFEFLIMDLSAWGILPRSQSGLWGILFYPLLHSNWAHLLSNSVPMFVLGFLTFFSYRKVAFPTFWIIYFLSGIGIWIFARYSIHLGASGLVYGLAFFLAFSGFFRKDLVGMAIAALVIFLYGGIVWGLLPIKPTMSFEGHIAGAVVGVMCAWRFRDVDKTVRKVNWKTQKEPDTLIEEPFWKPEEPEVIENEAEVNLDDIPVEFRYLYRKDNDKEA